MGFFCSLRRIKARFILVRYKPVRRQSYHHFDFVVLENFIYQQRCAFFMQSKEEILRQIISKEEDVLAKLNTLVQLAKAFVRIDENTGRIDFVSENCTLTNYEKIFLALVGKYFARQSGILEDDFVGISDLSDDLGVPVTTLSKPLRRLVQNRIVDKPEKNRYRVNPHRVEARLRELTQKYINSS